MCAATASMGVEKQSRAKAVTLCYPAEEGQNGQ